MATAPMKYLNNIDSYMTPATGVGQTRLSDFSQDPIQGMPGTSNSNMNTIAPDDKLEVGYDRILRDMNPSNKMKVRPWRMRRYMKKCNKNIKSDEQGNILKFEHYRTAFREMGVPVEDEFEEILKYTNFTPTTIWGYRLSDNTYPPMKFENKNGDSFVVCVDDKSSSSKFLVIKVSPATRYNDRQDRFGREGGYMIGGTTIGVLAIEEKEDNYWSVPDMGVDGLMVEDEYKRTGIATAMHDYANYVLGLKTKPSDSLKNDSKMFWKNRLGE
jgi:hypothetical protein